MITDTKTWSPDYEWRAVALLGLGFGLIGLNRWVVGTLRPCMADFQIVPGCGAPGIGLTYQQLGNLVGGLGVVWGVFAAISGRLADTIGHRKVLIPSLFLFTLMSGVSGLMPGFLGLLAVRALMGFAAGSYCPTSFAATAVAARPSRLGFLQGLQQSGFALLGFGLGPIVTTQLLAFVSWRQVYWILALPGLVASLLLFMVLREPPRSNPAAKTDAGYGAIFRSRNIILCMLALMCAMACIFVFGAMLPSYLTDYLLLSPTEMGFVASALGFGGFFGQFAVPGISDRLGRKPTAILAFTGAAATVWLFMKIEASPNLLFGVLFLIAFFTLGNVALITGPISTESAPAGLISSAIGLVVAAGEIFGGGIAPALGGAIAQNTGIRNIFWMPLAGVILGAFVCLALKETAPARTKHPGKG